MRVSTKIWALVSILASLSLLGCKTAPCPKVSHKTEKPWLGVHLFVRDNEAIDDLTRELPKLARLGVNVVVLEINYSFDFRSHPELRSESFITREHASHLVITARANGVRLVPQINCLGHQSWRRAMSPLLTKYPQFAEPLASNSDPETEHLRSWCPSNTEVYKTVFPLIDELIESFDSDAFHVGMDEVFTIGSDNCPRCKGQDPGKLFAKAVNVLHRHIVGKRKCEMLMWGDRLLDGKALGYSKWEAAKNGTHGAADLIPKDIVICDWHYEKQQSYPSVPLLLEKGFRVWPSGWQPLEATQAFSDFSRRQRAANPRLVGYLATTWSKAKPKTVAEWQPVSEILPQWK